MSPCTTSITSSSADSNLVVRVVRLAASPVLAAIASKALVVVFALFVPELCLAILFQLLLFILVLVTRHRQKVWYYNTIQFVKYYSGKEKGYLCDFY